MNPSALELDFDTTMVWVTLADGRKLGVPLAYFPRLLGATPEQRCHFEWSGGPVFIGTNLTKTSAGKASCWVLATEAEATGRRSEKELTNPAQR